VDHRGDSSLRPALSTRPGSSSFVEGVGIRSEGGGDQAFPDCGLVVGDEDPQRRGVPGRGSVGGAGHSAGRVRCTVQAYPENHQATPCWWKCALIVKREFSVSPCHDQEEQHPLTSTYVGPVGLEPTTRGLTGTNEDLRSTLRAR
jgi:hypothetical protein